MAPSSSSSFSTNFKGKYDVFLSFRGEDTRDSFTSHLYAALSGKKILTFMDNTNLTKGEEISKSISKAIEESTLSVIVFSKKYAFSKWCLDEVVKILECKKRNGQMVIPVFYRVDPVHVRNQTGSFEAAFAKHEELLKDKMDKVESWRAALKEAANISGWDSVVTRPDSKLIEEIVGDILKKLYKISPSNSIGLVGIDSRIKQIESLLCMDSSNVLMLGIWGMGGIGKTTLARAIFDRISIQYESCCFLVNVREQLKRCLLVHLQDELLSKILEENIDSRSPCLGVNFLKDRLRRKKVLVVLDDIDNARQLQELLPGLHDLFGPGSRILVTSRDKQVLKSVVDEIYKVEELNHQEALQLFCLNAFKKNCPEIDYVERSRRVVNYAKGNPLALRVLGSTLLGRSEEDWDSALEKLENVRNCEIQNVLRISYDGLDGEEKRIFLDIACFFRGEDRSYVTKILSGCYSSVHYTISTFIDKSLVSVSHNKLQMHDLLQEMGWSIVRNEPELGKRSRLWNSKDVYCVLTKKKGTRAIEGISLDLATAREMHLESDAFAGMDHLRILKFYMSNSSIGCNDKVHLPRRGLQSLSDELRYLHWHKFPSKSLPSKFSAENLVVLDLPHSNVEQLWTGAQDLMNLKQIGLCYSKYLTKIPDLSQAKNVESINLEGCKSLVELPSSIQYLHKLEYLNVRLCKSLRRLPSRIDSKLLRILDISHSPNVKYCPEVLENVVEFHLCRSGIKELPQSVHKLKALEIVWLIGCSNITKFPRVSMTVRELYLSETSIKEVPSSIEFLTGLEILEMISCNKLLRIPSTISKLKSLEILVLSHCSKLESFPEILEPMDSLACLYLDYCENLKRLPDSIYNLKSLEHLHLSGTAIQELPSSIEHLNCLKELKLDECKKLVSLPSSIHKVSQLRSIYLSYCKSLRALPELPLSLKVLEANGCRAMETFSSNRKSNFMNLSFTNCFKLDQKERSEIIENTHSTVQFLTSKFREYRDQVRILFQGNEIPECFHEQTMGTSLSIQLPPNWHQFQGIAFCIVFASEDPSIVCRISRFKCECHFRSNNKENEDIICNWVCFVDDLHLHEPDQVLLWYDPGIKALQGSGSAKEEDWFNKYSSASFQFYPQRWKKFQKHCKVKKCGVLLL